MPTEGTHRRSLRVPQKDTTLLEWFGSFESVFVLLHPFVAVEPHARSFFERDDGPTREELKKCAHPIGWQKIVSLANLDDICHLNRILLGWRNSSRTTEVSELLRMATDRNILLPEEGEIPYIVLDQILEGFKSMGFPEILLGDEFGKRQDMLAISDLLERPYPVLSVPHPRLIAPDCSFLVAAHWDLFCSFVCGPPDAIHDLVRRPGIEGFFCTDATRLYWHEQPLQVITATGILAGRVDS